MSVHFPTSTHSAIDTINYWIIITTSLSNLSYIEEYDNLSDNRQIPSEISAAGTLSEHENIDERPNTIMEETIKYYEIACPV